MTFTEELPDLRLLHRRLQIKDGSVLCDQVTYLLLRVPDTQHI